MATSEKRQIQVRSIDARRRMQTIEWRNMDAANVFDFDVKGDGVTDDTINLQRAIDYAYAKGVPCIIPAGSFKVTSPLKLYDSTTPAQEDGLRVMGVGIATIIKWYGSSSETPFRIIGAKGELSHLQILNQNATGWLSAIEYDGKSTIGRSSHGTIRNVFIDGNNYVGDGIALGRQGYQADMLEIDHCYIQNLKYGAGIVTLNSNALSTAIIAPTIVRCHIGIDQGQSNNINVFGGEIDNCDLNFRHNLGRPLSVTGLRTEGSKRVFWNNVSTADSQVTFNSLSHISGTTARAATTGAITNGQTTLTLSTIEFVSGDLIDIAGAGPAGGTLSTTILAMTSISASGMVVTVANAASTTVSAGAVTLTAGVIQPLFSENGGGPYTHINCVINDANLYAATVANGPQIFIGCRWEQNDIIDPFGSVAGTLKFQIGNLTTLGCTSNGNTRKMRAQLGEQAITTFTANDTTPSVVDNTQFITANSNPTTVTAFDDGYNGQRIQVLVNDANTSFGTGSIKTSTGAAVAAVNGRIYTFIRSGGNWYSTGL